MDKAGSGPHPPFLHPVIAPVAVALGLAAMLQTGRLAPVLGLRPTLIACELALGMPALALLLVPNLRGALGARGVGASTLLGALVSGAALWAASLGLLELQYSLWAPPPGYLQQFQGLHEALRPRGPLDFAFSVAAIALAPAVFEELLFRGVALAALLRALGTGGAVLLSSSLFAIIHLDFSGSGPTLYRVPFALAVGVGFALLRLRSGSLLPSMLAHAVVNATTFMAAMQEQPSAVLPEPRPALGAALLLGGLAGFAAVFRHLPRGGEAAGNPARLDSTPRR
jgi:membrane protease YdiL (CAAX protease family)